MKLDYLKEKKELVSVALFVLSALFAILILVKLTGFFAASARAENIVKRAATYEETNDDMERYFSKYKALANELKKNNLFAPPPPKQHPVKEVSGILGNEVLIKDKWYTEGAMVGDAKIVAIEPMKVTIEWDGGKKDFAPLDSADSSGSGDPKTPQPSSASNPPGEADMVVISSPSGPTGRPTGERESGGPRGMRGRFFGDMSDADRERFIAEMRERRAQFENMSPAERERFRNEMRERFGGGMPGGGRGQGSERRGRRE